MTNVHFHLQKAEIEKNSVYLSVWCGQADSEYRCKINSVRTVQIA